MEHSRHISRHSSNGLSPVEMPQVIDWRREGDSNPRYGLSPYNGLANRRLQPLGHPSGLAGPTAWLRHALAKMGICRPIATLVGEDLAECGIYTQRRILLQARDHGDRRGRWRARDGLHEARSNLSARCGKARELSDFALWSCARMGTGRTEEAEAEVDLIARAEFDSSTLLPMDRFEAWLEYMKPSHDIQPVVHDSFRRPSVSSTGWALDDLVFKTSPSARLPTAGSRARVRVISFSGSMERGRPGQFDESPFRTRPGEIHLFDQTPESRGVTIGWHGLKSVFIQWTRGSSPRVTMRNTAHFSLMDCTRITGFVVREAPNGGTPSLGSNHQDRRSCRAPLVLDRRRGRCTVPKAPRARSMSSVTCLRRSLPFGLG